MKPRDMQQSKLYKAEEVLQAYAQPLPEVKDIERFVKKVWASKRVQDIAPPAFRYGPPEVMPGRGRRRASGGASSISMPRWSRNTYITLHELAHTMTIRKYGHSVVPSHGWQYCAIYLKLVLCMMGREAYDTLRASFRKHRVKYREKQTRKITPERKEQLRNQVQTALAAKAAKTKRHVTGAQAQRMADIADDLGFDLTDGRGNIMV